MGGLWLWGWIRLHSSLCIGQGRAQALEGLGVGLDGWHSVCLNDTTVLRFV